MDGNASGAESDNYDWDTEDELEIQDMPLSSCPALQAGQEPLSGNGNINWDSEDDLEIQDMPHSSRPPLSPPDRKPTYGNGEASSSAAPFNSKLIQRFVAMGFSEVLVAKAIQDNGEASDDVILETLLTYTALESSPQQVCANSDLSLSESDKEYLSDLSDSDSWSGAEENFNSLSEKERTLVSLEKMGYTKEEASIALERCGLEASISELTDFICAAQMARAEDINWQDMTDDIKPKLNHNGKMKKRKLQEYERRIEKRPLDESSELIRLPNPMIGFGLPAVLCPRDEICPVIPRSIPPQARGPPFFYYENVALAPKGVWDTISRSLYEIEPEFVDSKYFCAAARKRGYIHNLPTENRFPLLPLPPRTIHEALPLTKRWWPSWDTRTKLNCLQTAIGSARLTDRIRKAIEEYDTEPPLSVQKFVIEQCRKWNLVWVGTNKVAPLECDEVELLLGFPKNHTRGGGISRTDRYKSLGNSFQVDTVAYHLSVLKDMFPDGINLLSLFSGIGGAEVALHRLGIPLKNVVSVEKSEVNRNIVRSWWEQTNQRGTLIHYDDVQVLNRTRLEQHIGEFGGFDLVIGGSPCNNLAGSNRVSRDGLEGEHSSLFYHYPRILELVRSIMSTRQY